MDQQLIVWLVGVGLLLIGIWPYRAWILQVTRNGGKVAAGQIGSGEFALALVLVAWFGLVILQGLVGPRKPIDAKTILSASKLLAVMVGVLALFLHYRGKPLHTFLGLFAIPPRTICFAGFRMLLAALPMVLVASIVTNMLLGSKAQSQEIVEFFVQAIENRDHGSLLLVAGLGVVVAPVAEEFIFRGFLYPVFKRFLGIPLAIVISALLFAAIHANAGSLGALFVLAVAFTLAYEITGSILVPMLMHALFNLASLTLLYLGSGVWK